MDKNGKVKSSTRLKLAAKVFSKVSKYDSIISSYLSSKLADPKEFMQDKILIEAHELDKLRYGENPHQKSKLYKIINPPLTEFDYNQLSGKALSFNNLVDTESAYSCVEQFSKPSCVIVKHANPCGAASSNNLNQAYDHAYKTDPTSAFGGIIVFNKKLNSELLKKIIKRQFVEVIAAPYFDKKCLEIIKEKPNIRMLEIKLKNKGDLIYESKLLRDKLLIQEKDEKVLTKKSLQL